MRFARRDCRTKAAARLGRCLRPHISRRFSIGLFEIEGHVVLVDKLFTYAEGAELPSVGFKSKRSIKLLRSGLAGGDRKLDLFEIRQLSHAFQQGYQQSASQALPARCIGHVHTPYASFVSPLEGLIAEETGGSH